MATGPKPIPTQLKIVRGNPGKRPLPEDEPQIPASRPEAPSTLSEGARQHWDVVVERLADAKIMTNLDIPALEIYCEAYAKWADANQKIQEHGPLIKSPQGFPMQSPYLQIANKAFDQMKAMLVEFGMTPSSRTKVRTTESGKKDDFGDI